MQIKLALTGNLQREIAFQTENVKIGVTMGVKTAAGGLQRDLRRQTRGPLGNRVANAWRMQVYPSRGVSAGAAALIYTKAPDIVRAHVDGGVIRSADGFWLAWPTENAPRRGKGGKRINPSNFPEDRFGPLRFVYRRGKPGLLVVDGLRARTGKRGGFGKAGKRQRSRGHTATVVMFILLPQVRLRRTIQLEGPARAWQGRLPNLIAREILRAQSRPQPQQRR